MPTVSVIIPAYNAAPFIGTALDSVAAQTRRPDEVVVVDDGSTDDTAEIVRRWARQSGICAKLVRQRNRGLAAARNSGLSVASGDYITFLDADDVWLRAKTEKQVEFMESHQECDLLFSDYEIHDVGGARAPAFHNVVHPKRGDVFLPLYTTDIFCWVGTVMFRSRLLREGFRFNPQYRMTEDYDAWLRLSLKYRFDYLDDVLAEWRRNPGSLSSKTCAIYAMETIMLRRIIPIAAGRLPRRAADERLRRNHIKTFAAYWLIGRKTKAVSYFARAFFNDGFRLRTSLPLARYVLATILKRGEKPQGSG